MQAAQRRFDQADGAGRSKIFRRKHTFDRLERRLNGADRPFERMRIVLRGLPHVMSDLAQIIHEMIEIGSEAGQFWHYVAGNEDARLRTARAEEHTSELQSLMRITYVDYCLKKKKNTEHTVYNR